MKLVRIGEVAGMLGVPINTVRNWTNSGKLHPVRISDSGHRYYRMEEVREFMNSRGWKKDTTIRL